MAGFYSAVDTPDGRSISAEIAAIPGADYTEIEDEDGHTTTTVLIPFPLIGDYQIKATPKPGASPTDTYLLSAIVADRTTVLADNEQVQDIPEVPFILTVPMTVDIDIKPRNRRNIIDLDDDDLCEDDDKLRVAILSSTDFDALKVDELTVELGDPRLDGKAIPIRSRPKYVDRDRRGNLLLKFTICDLVTSEAIDQNTTELVLTGATLGGIPIAGSDAVHVRVDQEENEENDHKDKKKKKKKHDDDDD